MFAVFCLCDWEVARDFARVCSPGAPQANSANLWKFPLIESELGGTLRAGGRRLLIPSNNMVGLHAVLALAM